jgi:formylglycine-generating enzyme required for sulfatase activity
LYPRDRVPAGFVHVPAGELVLLRDKEAIRPREADGPVWVDDFFMARREVALGEYLQFVNSLPADERLGRLPAREQIRLGSNGVYEAASGRTGEDPAQYPVAGVSFANAEAYAQWRAARDGVPFRLPTQEEWEKAAGAAFVVGFPWGGRFSGGEANLAVGPEPGRLPLRVGGSFPLDRSVYGCDDMGGSVSEWTSSLFATGIHVVKGGSFAKTSELPRVASREPVDDAHFRAAPERYGFRLAFRR